MKSTVELFLSIVAILIFSASVSARDVRIIDTKEMKTFVAGRKKVVIVDARTTGEYAAGHIPKAINIPYEKFPTIEQYLLKDKKVPVIFYCRGYS